VRRPIVVLGVAGLLLATVGPPAGSAQEEALDLREGFWFGESIAWLSPLVAQSEVRPIAP
jgi:hypothetical protein